MRSNILKNLHHGLVVFGPGGIGALASRTGGHRLTESHGIVYRFVDEDRTTAFVALERSQGWRSGVGNRGHLRNIVKNDAVANGVGVRAGDPNFRSLADVSSKSGRTIGAGDHLEALILWRCLIDNRRVDGSRSANHGADSDGFAGPDSVERAGCLDDVSDGASPCRGEIERQRTAEAVREKISAPLDFCPPGKIDRGLCRAVPVICRATGNGQTGGCDRIGYAGRSQAIEGVFYRIE